MKESATPFTYTAQRSAYLGAISPFIFLTLIEGGAYVLIITLVVQNILLKFVLLGALIGLVLFMLFGRLLPPIWTKHWLTKTHLYLHYGLTLKVAIPRTELVAAQPVRERLMMVQPLQAQYEANKHRIVAAFSEQGQVLLHLDKPHTYKMGRSTVSVEKILINVDDRDRFLVLLCLPEAPSPRQHADKETGQRRFPTAEAGLPPLPDHGSVGEARNVGAPTRGALPTCLRPGSAPGSPPTAIRIAGLTRRFDTLIAVDNLHMTIRQGEIYGFLGSNGAGKTTTMKMLVGLLQPNEGRAWIAEHDVSTEPLEAKAALGYVPDRSVLYERLTGREFLAFLGQIHGMPLKETEERIEYLLNLLELTEDADRLCGAYSFGMKRKLSLAGALLHQPEVLILDEPLNGLDPRSAHRLKDLFLELAAGGTTILLSTHDLATAEAVCHRIGIIHRGKLLAEGSPSELRQLASAPDLEAVFLNLTAGRTDQPEEVPA